jgi:hypothetical protein
MLQPTKYLDINTCVIRIASIIVTELTQFRALRLSELDDKTRQITGESGKINFLPALNFLFLTGIIDYDGVTDSVFILSKILETKYDETL